MSFCVSRLYVSHRAVVDELIPVAEELSHLEGERVAHCGDAIRLGCVVDQIRLLCSRGKASKRQQTAAAVAGVGTAGQQRLPM